MTRIFEAPAYGPQGACYWAETVPDASWQQLTVDMQTDVAVIGGGFTGLNAALALAEAGVSVALLEAEHPGWGASGRNGGFCCLGGAKASDAMLARRFGSDAPREWARTEVAAVDHVSDLITRHGWDVDRHSQGETLLAHTPRAFAGLEAKAAGIADSYGTAPMLHTPADLAVRGLGGPWHGGMTLPVGFAINPRKYHLGLSQAAEQAGAALFANSPVTGLTRTKGGWRVQTPKGRLTAGKVVIATNGYSHEDLPSWLRARTMPLQSTVIVTRPLTKAEQDAAGWWSAQMAYDTRFLLHYFRLLPNGRFLFGMRGGLRATPAIRRRIARRIRADFARLFPAWKDVEITHEWSGLVCLMRNLVPFLGPVPGHDGLFAGLGFHGNGVAMGSYTGRLLADRVMGIGGKGPDWLGTPPPRFPLGRFRRLLLAPAYLWAESLDL